ncbi:MAG: hypothetical protein K9M84_09695 [Spirochaetia bacterium]|nr:hypothetical protein [Spirochaetia bacterium]MCF7941874.1 hypothetical protein [Spirochaetia bacterium]
MIEKEQIRKYDFISSIVLIIVSCIILIGAFRMPMQGSFAGVQNQWYVSPALMPLIIGFGLLLLSLVLLLNSFISGGVSLFFQDLKKYDRSAGMNEKTLRVIMLVLMLFNYIYLMIPRVDFFLSTSLFLLCVVGVFYIEHGRLAARITSIELIWTLVLLVLAVSGLFERSRYVYDLLGMVVYASVVWFFIRYTADDPDQRRRVKTTILVALLTPGIICPLFRYMLLVPLPVEGIIFDGIFNSIYYLVR